MARVILGNYNQKSHSKTSNYLLSSFSHSPGSRHLITFGALPKKLVSSKITTNPTGGYSHCSQNLFSTTPPSTLDASETATASGSPRTLFTSSFDIPGFKLRHASTLPISNVTGARLAPPPVAHAYTHARTAISPNLLIASPDPQIANDFHHPNSYRFFSGETSLISISFITIQLDKAYVLP